MFPFGFRISLVRNRSLPVLKRWLKNSHAFLVGNADLHGLVRCPPLAKRWKSSASWICDVGCGSGAFHLEILLQSSSAVRVVGLDTDWAALSRASRLSRSCGLQAQVHYVCGSVNALPFREEIFDQLFLVDVLEHVSDDRHALAETRRILRHGGWLEISTPTPLYPVVFGRKIHTAVGHVRDGYRPDDLRQHLKAECLEVISLRGNTGILTWPWMALWYRLAWLTLWNPRCQVILIRMVAHGILVAACLGARLTRRLDGLGGYCSNDVEARKTDA
jgi:SAM-dependent methyltransferase